MLDPRVEDVLHVVPPRVGDDRAVAERARAELHASLEPADDVAGGDALCDEAEERVVVEELRLEPGRAKRTAAARIRVLGPGVRVIHDEGALPPELAVPDVVRGADGDAAVAGRGLDVQPVERRLATDAAVRDGVQRDAAGEAEVRRPRAPLRLVDDVQVRVLEHGLQRAGDVLVVLRQLARRLARRPEDLLEARREDAADRRRPLRPRHVDAAVVVREVVEVQLEELAVQLHEVAHLRAVHVRLAVRREPHHLPLVAVLREAEPLRDGRVVDAERVRERDTVEHLQPVAATDRDERRREVAEAVERQHRRLVERRDEERGRRVRLVVLDVVERRAQSARARCRAPRRGRPSRRGCGSCCACGRRRSAGCGAGRASATTFAPRFARGSRPIAT